MSINIRTFTRAAALAVAAATVPVAIFASATAAAEVAPGSDPQTDRQFLNTLAANGVHFSDTQTALHDAGVVCHLLGSAQPLLAVDQHLTAQVPGMTTQEAATFIAASVNYYCPQYNDSPHQ